MQKVKLPLPTSEVICSDNLAYLKTIPDNFFDSVVTDPPYGLGDEPDALEVLKDWIEKGYHEVKAKGGFMGKSWDNFGLGDTLTGYSNVLRLSFKWITMDFGSAS
jgi:DNA modification methylase